MHCVDCHTRNDTMGDGHLYRRLEDQVEIQCETCHGTPDAYATGVTRKGTKLAHLEKRTDGWFMKSRVTGALHRVKQSRDVVRPGSADYNAAAALAMTPDTAASRATRATEAGTRTSSGSTSTGTRASPSSTCSPGRGPRAV
jgi:hypothetical protein